MLLSYQECIDKYGSDYKLKKELAGGNLFMKEKGIYSTKRNASEIDVIMREASPAILAVPRRILIWILSVTLSLMNPS